MDAGPALPNRLLERLTDRPVQPAEHFPAQSVGTPPGIYLGAEKAFIGINISDPGHQMLVEEQVFDPPFAPLVKKNKFPLRDLQGFRAQPAHSRRKGLGIFRGQKNLAESPGVPEKKPFRLPFKGQGQMKVRVESRRFKGGLPEKPAGHPQMKPQDAIAAIDGDKFAAAENVLNLFPRQLRF